MTSVAPYITEKEFLATIRSMARAYGWRTYHTLRSKGSEPGFPDLILLRPPVVIFAELKSERGRLTRQQDEWLTDLGQLALRHRPDIQVYCWRPSDLDQIQDILEVGHGRLLPRDRR